MEDVKQDISFVLYRQDVYMLLQARPDIIVLTNAQTHKSRFTVGGNGTTTMVGHGGCTPILCKVQPALIQACASYNEGASLGTGSVTVSAEIGTNVALLWNSSTKIATFAFRGTDGGKVSLACTSDRPSFSFIIL